MSNKDDDNEEKAEKASVGAVPYDAEDPGDTDDDDDADADGSSIDADTACIGPTRRLFLFRLLLLLLRLLVLRQRRRGP